MYWRQDQQFCFGFTIWRRLQCAGQCTIQYTVYTVQCPVYSIGFSTNPVCQNCMVWWSGGCLCQETVYKMQFLGVVGFKSSTLTVFCISTWRVHQKLKTYLTLCVLYGLSHLSLFRGFKYISPPFLPRVTNHYVKSNILKKVIFLVIAQLHKFVIMLKNLEENLRYLWMWYKNFNIYNTYIYLRLSFSTENIIIP